MQPVTPIPELVNDLTRTEKLEVYLNRIGSSYASIGDKLGVSRSTALRMLRSAHIPTYRHRQLSSILPAELLPEAKDVPPGPKPRKRDMQ